MVLYSKFSKLIGVIAVLDNGSDEGLPLMAKIEAGSSGIRISL